MGKTEQRPTLDGRLLSRFSELVDRIYQAAVSPGIWQSVTEGIANLHGAHRAQLLTPSTPPSDGGFIFCHGLSEADVQLWAAKYVHHDPWVKAAGHLFRDGFVFLSEEIISRPELEKTIFYKEYAAKVDLGSFCAGVVFDDSHSDLLVPTTTCSFSNKLNGPQFTDENKQIHALIINHLSRSIGTMYRLRDSQFRLMATMAALDRITTGVALFGRRGQVTFANEAARELFRANDGISLRAGNPLQDETGWMRAARESEQQVLTHEIRNAVAMNPILEQHFSTGISISRPSGKRPYLIRLSTLTANGEFSTQSGVHAIGFISDMDAKPQLDSEMLSRVFGLTRTEARIASALLSADSIEGIAKHLAISENTVKSHLKNIFEKTRTRRQAELVRLLSGLASTRVAR